MNEPPDPSGMVPEGLLLSTLVATPSPLNPAVPFPATVVRFPPGSTWRMRWFKVSVMKNPPDPSGTTPTG
jgi:hypothetical protein